jgi:hypothetical protein
LDGTPVAFVTSPGEYVVTGEWIVASMQPPVLGSHVWLAGQLDSTPPSASAATLPMHSLARNTTISPTRSVGTCTSVWLKRIGVAEPFDAVTSMRASWSGLLPAAIDTVAGRLEGLVSGISRSNLGTHPFAVCWLMEISRWSTVSGTVRSVLTMTTSPPACWILPLQPAESAKTTAARATNANARHEV